MAVWIPRPSPDRTATKTGYAKSESRSGAKPRYCPVWSILAYQKLDVAVGPDVDDVVEVDFKVLDVAVDAVAEVGLRVLEIAVDAVVEVGVEVPEGPFDVPVLIWDVVLVVVDSGGPLTQ